MDSKYDELKKLPGPPNGSQFRGATTDRTAFPAKRKAPPVEVKQKVARDANSDCVATARAQTGGANQKVISTKAKIEAQRRELPVYGCQAQLMSEVEKSETVLIMGETGSGKTTQIPQFLLASGYGKHGIIGITQPRRVAAITVARRVALEQDCRLGGRVGYSIRFENCTSAETRICFLTDGALLREALSDKLLERYSVIMLDEVHERTVTTDVLFGLMKRVQRERKELRMEPLKLIITSATMDIDHFSQYFGVCGIYLEGRTHPVRVFHTKEPQPEFLHAALSTLFDIDRTYPINHAVLMFLTGQEEIEAVALQIRHIVKSGAAVSDMRVFPLYSQLPQAKQLECFQPTPPNVRKVVLATNIAETSVTIPGIRCVIDSGYVKRRVYNAGSGLDILRIGRIAQAQAWQRCGRAGRDAPGFCHRVYTKQEMSSFERMPRPEILRINLLTATLQLLALGIDCRTFDFLDAPPTTSTDIAFKKLVTLGAIKDPANPTLTDLGRKMVLFPLDPCYSKLILSAPSFGCLEEILSIVAVLSSENVFLYGGERRELANLAHTKFYSKRGDHLTMLNIYRAFQKTDKLKLWCHDNFLSLRNLLYARDARNQMLQIVEKLGLEVSSCGSNVEQVQRCLLGSLFENIAELQRDGSYATVIGRQRSAIHPSSVLQGYAKPAYLIYTEIVLTARTFLRQLTEIQAEWIPEVVPKYPFLHRIKKPLT